MTGSTPRIFDTARVRRNLARAREEQSGFLTKSIAEEVAQRMSLVLRDFETVLVHGVGADETATRLSASGRFRNILRAGSRPGPSVDLVFDPEALPIAPGRLDCLVSLLTLQSVNDLPGALIQIRQALKPDGLFLACLFAGTTLSELRAAWLEAESEHSGGVTPRVAPFADVRELGMLLQRAGFALPVADSDRTTVRYPDALALMREIKALGFANALIDRARRLTTPRLLAKAVAAYEEHFADPDGRVRATVEIAWLTAWSPHQSQQQPLKPGSAKARLADALKTTETPLPRD